MMQHFEVTSSSNKHKKKNEKRVFERETGTITKMGDGVGKSDEQKDEIVWDGDDFDEPEQ